MPDIILESADEGSYMTMSGRGENILSLMGRVHLRLGKRRIYADFVRINLARQEIFARGKVWLWEKDNWVQGQELYYNRARDQGVLYHTRGSMPPFSFRGKRIRQINKELIILDQAELTTCSRHCPHYTLQVQKVWLYGARKLVAVHAWLHVGNLPVFYFPFFYQTTEGTGILTRFGQSERRGYYIQNTVGPGPFRLPLVEGLTWDSRFALDFYQRMGEFVGMEHEFSAEGFKLTLDLHYARHYPVDFSESLQRYRNVAQGDSLIKQDWYHLDSSLDTKLFHDPWGEHSAGYQVEWFNHAYMYPFFVQRTRPQNTGDILSDLFQAQTWTTPKRRLDWQGFYRRKGEHSRFLLKVQRRWQWDTSKSFLAEDAEYLPLSQSLPRIFYNYNRDFLLKGMGMSSVWRVEAAYEGDRAKHYDNRGQKVHDYWYNEGLIQVTNQIQLMRNWLSVSPAIGYGFRSKDPYGHPNQDQKLEAQRKSYHYTKTGAAAKLGSEQLYWRNEYNYERSFWDEAVVEPFRQERANKWKTKLYLAPLADFVLQAETAYDFRSGFERELDRWEDVRVRGDWLISFINFNDPAKINFYDKYSLAFSRLHISNSYNYVTAWQRHGVNDLSVTYEAGGFSWGFLSPVRLVALGGRWLHDFQNNLRDRFFFTWKIDVTLWRYWNVQAGGNSVMEQLYRYKQDVDPWQDISDSMRVWDGERRNASLFRLKNFYVQLSHDLHCWEMIVGWQVSQQLQPFGVHLNHRLSYYDHRVYFAFHSKQQRSVGIQPTEIYRHQVDSEDYN